MLSPTDCGSSDKMISTGVVLFEIAIATGAPRTVYAHGGERTRTLRQTSRVFAG